MVFANPPPTICGTRRGGKSLTGCCSGCGLLRSPSITVASHDIYHIMVPDIMVQPDLGCTLEADGMAHRAFRCLALSLSPLSSALCLLASALCPLRVAFASLAAPLWHSCGPDRTDRPSPPMIYIISRHDTYHGMIWACLEAEEARAAAESIRCQASQADSAPVSSIPSLA